MAPGGCSPGSRIWGSANDQSHNLIWLLQGASGVMHALERLPQQGRAPSWSPDARRIAFESDRGGCYALFVATRDGSQLKRVTDSYLNATHPVWAPDGQHLAFIAREPCNLLGSHVATLALSSAQ